MSSSEWSYWEQNSFLNDIDVLVAGAGIVGLNCALELKNREPSLRVVICDRSYVPAGASTRNAGFACFGCISELLDDLEQLSEDEVFVLVERRWRGLQIMRSMLGDREIEFNSFGGYELFTSDQEDLYKKCIDKVELFNKRMEDITGFQGVFSLKDDQLEKFGFSGVKHLIYNELEGQLHPGKMIMALFAKAKDAGVEFWGGCEIKDVDQAGNKIELKDQNNRSIKCNSLAVCTNGFASSLLSDLNVEPGRGQVFITKPIDHKLKGVYHYDRGYVYFRDVGDRILIGGGRNIDVDNERTNDFGTSSKIEEYISNILNNHILPNQKIEMDMKWSGIMGLGTDRTTIVQKTSENIYCGVRLGGMGVAIGTLVGQELAELIISDINQAV